MVSGATVIYILAGLSVVCFTAVFLIGAVKRLRSRGEEAGTPEPLDVNDEMALAEAIEKDDFGIWEAECAKLQRLADKLGTR